MDVKKYRLLLVLLLIVIVPLGFYTKFYGGPGHAWVNNTLGGFIYEVFWCLVVAFLLPGLKPLRIAVYVFSVTCLLEVLQLWHPGFLEYLRSFFIGRTILGSAFSWMDFPYYAAGSATGWYILRLFGKISAVNPHTSDRPWR